MCTQESLSLLHRFESSHPTLSHPGRFMGLLCPIIRILRSIVDYVRNQVSMSNAITAQLICDNLPGFAPMRSQEALEESLSSGTIPPRLKVYINHLTTIAAEALLSGVSSVAEIARRLERSETAVSQMLKRRSGAMRRNR
jgi:hypothetical protein